MKLNLLLSLGILLTSCTNQLGDANFQSDSQTSSSGAKVDSLRLGDRNYVSNVITNVFGTSSSVSTATTALIKTQYDSFGGACDIYASLSEDCTLRSNTQMAHQLSSTSARESLRIRACYASASDDTGLRFAISRARSTTPDSIDLNTISYPNDSDLENSYGLFHVGEDPTIELKLALKSLVQAAKASENARETWRFLLITLCSDPSWQML